MNSYSAYGVDIESNVVLDALPHSRKNMGALKLIVRRVSQIKQDNEVAWGHLYAQGRQIHLVTHEDYVVFQADRLFSVQFWIATKTIRCDVADDVSNERLRYWVLQQFLPVFLFLSGSTEFLHGMAVSTHPVQSSDQEIAHFSGGLAFLGPSYSGKSTLLNYFLSRGHAVITDDHLALGRDSYTDVLPATPFYRPYRALEDVGLTAAHFASGATSLKRIFLIEPASPESLPRIDVLAGVESIAAIAWHLQYALPDQEQAKFFPFLRDRFHGLTNLARRVRVARLHVPRSLDRLSEVYDFIQRDLEH